MEYEADKRSYRVLKLFETFQKLGHGAVLDKKEFAEEMGVSERSVQRDIRTINGYLSDCGNSSEIVYDRQRNGYRLCQEDTRFLDKGEILAVCKILIESRAFSKAELKTRPREKARVCYLIFLMGETLPKPDREKWNSNRKKPDGCLCR